MSETDKQTNRERDERRDKNRETETEEVKQREIVCYTFYNGECLHVHIVRASEKGESYSKGLRLMIISLLSLWITVT